jgi:hypothetical protein
MPHTVVVDMVADMAVATVVDMRMAVIHMVEAIVMVAIMVAITMAADTTVADTVTAVA